MPIAGSIGYLPYPPRGDIFPGMENGLSHTSHPGIVKRLKRADGHLQSVIRMIDDGRACVDIAQQLHAVEKAITQAKRALIQDHIDHCLDAAMTDIETGATAANTTGATSDLTTEFKTIAKYL